MSLIKIKKSFETAPKSFTFTIVFNVAKGIPSIITILNDINLPVQEYRLHHRKLPYISDQ